MNENNTEDTRQGTSPLPDEQDMQNQGSLEEQEQTYRDYVAHRRAHLARHITPQTLKYLEEEFRTDLPCYQTRDPLTGQPLKPNPIAAALRDGQREVILWLRHELDMHKRSARVSRS